MKIYNSTLENTSSEKCNNLNYYFYFVENETSHQLISNMNKTMHVFNQRIANNGKILIIIGLIIHHTGLNNKSGLLAFLHVLLSKVSKI